MADEAFDPDSTVETEAESPEVDEIKKPPLVMLFERLGLVRGAYFREVDAIGIEPISAVDVEEIYGYMDGDATKAVIIFREAGMATRHYIQWQHIVRLIP